ncbi:MAG: hypothetical protein RLZZ387_5257 [Chloroflexota bacterium]
MTSSYSTNIDSPSTATDLTTFGVFLDAHRPALAAAMAQSPGLGPIPAERRLALSDRTVGALIATLGNPDAAAAWCGELLNDPQGPGLPALETHIFLDAAREQLLAAALDALVAGVGGAKEGVTTIMHQLDAVHRTVTIYFQKEREAETRRVNARLEQSLATSPLATIEWDRTGSILRWNPAAERIFGWSADEAVGKNIIALLVPDIQAADARAISASVLRNENLSSLRHENKHKDGRVLTCQWYNALLRDEQGEAIGALSQVQDVTEEIRAEEALRESQEQLIMAQQAALRELSTPLIPLADGLVAMPLIGSIDSTRAQQVIEGLLEGVSANHARVAILDITGVPVVDTQVANALLRAAQAVKLLGARVVLTGIRPEVAQTLVGLGVDLTSIVTRSSLQAGIAYAMGK